MAIKIDKQIVDYDVQTSIKVDSPVESMPSGDDTSTPTEPTSAPPKSAEIIQMHERVERPEMLVGSTYKIKTPLSDHALYVTINDIVLNQGTEHEQRRPFEVFINSKNMEHFQWIVALTRIISAVFRKGGDVTFLVEELRSVFDPKGGYFKKGGKYMPSLVAELGDAIDSHLRSIGLIIGEPLDEQQQQYLDEARARLEAKNGRKDGHDIAPEDLAFPEYAAFCQHCLAKAVIQTDGCLTCLNCGDSKCG
jgi:hypothetical protein